MEKFRDFAIKYLKIIAKGRRRESSSKAPNNELS